MLVLLLGDLHLPLRASSLPLKFRKLLVPGKIQQIICTGNVCDRETWEYLRTIAPDVKGVKGDFDESPHLPPTLSITHSPIKLGIIHGHQIVPLGDHDLLNSLATTMDVDVLISGATHQFKAYEENGKFFINPGSATGAWCSVWPVYDQRAEENEDTKQDQDKAESDQRDDNKESKEDKDKKEPSKEDDDKESNKEDGKEESKEDEKKKPNEKKPLPAVARTPHPDPTPSFVLLDIQGSTIMCYVYQLIAGEVKVEKIEYKKSLSD
ncbi:unnamed protein product [Sympodiomycopsis kandeliae]